MSVFAVGVQEVQEDVSGEGRGGREPAKGAKIALYRAGYARRGNSYAGYPSTPEICRIWTDWRRLFPPRPSILSDFPIFRWNYLSGELWQCHSSWGILSPPVDCSAPTHPISHSSETGGFGGISWKNAFPVALCGLNLEDFGGRHAGFGAESFIFRRGG